MKLLKFSLLCLTLAPLALPARAQDNASTGLSWRNRASLKSIKRDNAKWNMRADYPSFAANTPLARYASWQERLAGQNGVTSMLKEFGSYETDGIAVNGYSYESTPTLRFYGPNLISLENFVAFDTKGAHPNSFINTRNYGVVNGRPKLLSLGNFFAPGADYRAKTAAKVMSKLRNNERASWVADGSVKALTTEQLNNFSVGRDGLTWIFSPYEMGPYAAGYVEARLSPNELGPDFRRELLK